MRSSKTVTGSGPFRRQLAYSYRQSSASIENDTPCGDAPQAIEISPANRALMPSKKSAASVALGATVRSLRVERGLAQETFAARAEMDRSYYGAIERGEFNISLDTIVKLAGAFEISAAALIERARL